MGVSRFSMAWLSASLLLAAGPAAATDGPETARAWHGPAAATAEAAASSAAKAKEAVVPPQPKPAERPLAATPAETGKAKDGDRAATKEKSDKDKAGKDTAAATPAPPAAAPAPATKDKAAKDKPKKPVVTAKQLFGTVKTAAPLAARAVGWYAKGCLAGGKPIAIDGPGWQVMRLSRNRNWGHPDLIALVERLARETTAAKEWSGLLVGDISQPRGGPMISGHASHQVGLDADIWLTPMPDRTLTRREREDMSAVSMLASYNAVNTKVWGDGQVKLIKRAASYPAVERILVHPALKKALCEAAGTDRTWLNKVRPYFGHFYHFHMRIGCPKGSSNCQAQPPVPAGDGCDTELEQWLKKVAPKPKPKPKPLPPTAEKPPVKPAKPPAKKPEMTLADLPPDCGSVLTAGGHVPPTVPAEVVDRSKNAAPEKAIADDATPPAAAETKAATPKAAATQ